MPHCAKTVMKGFTVSHEDATITSFTCMFGNLRSVTDLYEEYGPQCVSESLLSCSNPLLPIINDFFQGTVESPTFYTPDNCR